MKALHYSNLCKKSCKANRTFEGRLSLLVGDTDQTWAERDAAQQAQGQDGS